ncbi:hypothetical protein PHMEG_00037546 [Phytophthora megakarya]|uniref:Uncharacterized protein n=1 Tax=Phytophthora megakarya TaxID=4795 RepID=A0A225UJQ3_9STRA|nr:hypothetical protein PHMEG_00037546 [Phytophthora megakarya]
MSPTQASTAADRYFPHLNGRIFIIWKTRVSAALQGEMLLVLVIHTNYAGGDDLDFSDEEKDLDPALFEENQGGEENSLGRQALTHRQTPPQSNLFVVQSFTATKQNERKRAGKLKAKRSKLSYRSLRLSISASLPSTEFLLALCRSADLAFSNDVVDLASDDISFPCSVFT